MIKKVTDSNQLSRLVLKGYKSIAACDIELGSLNVLIGANGAGKSNFIGFFRLIDQMLNQQLQKSVGLAGGPDALLHFGRKKTEMLAAEVHFLGNAPYKFELIPTSDHRMMFNSESAFSQGSTEVRGAGHFESQANGLDTVHRLRVYHFHDTGSSALVKQLRGINDNEYLRDDARNLAAFLYRLSKHHEPHYKRIVKSVQLVAPFFGGFHLRPSVDNPEKIQLEWTEAGQDEPFTASALSDGTLRFICLATVLLQPEAFMPATILIDEPELGLHPFAIKVWGGMMKSTAQKHQIIVSTQSVELVNEFDIDNLIVVDKKGGASTFNRPNAEALSEWLHDYSLGEMWKKNLLGGRPTR
jgi:predicted ATPase